MMEIKDWKESTLWAELQLDTDADGVATATLLAKSMPEIQAVLAQGGTAETDFTLHDSGHAYRVAQRMVEIIPTQTLAALSCYEKALLLMSAYLHDIGMTPRKSRTSAIHKYLLTGEANGFAGDERDKLQQWLDDFRGGIVPPIASSATTVAALETAEELVTYYARHRHNDWSEEWIREHFSDSSMGTYKGWLEDLIRLCRSHHYGYDELRSDVFLPRIVGGHGDVVNLRYLAAVLRIADVLEFDPERTPAVVFKHRDVSVGSVIYWHKDHEISLRIDNGRVLISARPNSARIHKAIEDTVAQIDEELAMCRRLAEELPFNLCPFLPQPTAHEWILASTTQARIEPLRNSYEYINGAFRPNTSRILNMLSGVELYGNPFAAVREAVQNASDAVREQMAYVRLRRENPASATHATELARSHCVSLRIEADDRGYWLICADSGVGMNKRIICDYLLISGQSHRHDILELERRCQRHGFSIERTGQFGIGVLSYFMIASRIEISTRRSHESGSYESHGWHFVTDGVGSFGELRVDNRIEAGTTVRMLLRPNVLGSSPRDWAAQLLAYLTRTLRRLPCRFEIAADVVGLPSVSLQPGWVSTTEEVCAEVCADLKRNFDRSARAGIPVELLPASTRAQKLEFTNSLVEIEEAIKRSLRCDVCEGQLPHGMGAFRSRVVYFELPGGASLRLLRSTVRDDRVELAQIGEGYSLPVEGELIAFWKGIRAHLATAAVELSQESGQRRVVRREAPGNIVLEIDWTSGVGVSVDRQRLTLSNQGGEALDYAIAQAQQHLQRFVAANARSNFQLLNHRLIDVPGPSQNAYWISQTAQGATWDEMRFPMIDMISLGYGGYRGILSWRGQHVTVRASLTDPDENSPYEGLTWHGTKTPPSRIVVSMTRYRHRPIPLWERIEKAASGPLTVEFPPSWNLIGIHFNRFGGLGQGQHVWNKRHVLIRALTAEALGWCARTFRTTSDPLQHKAEILQNQAHACAWLMHTVSTGQADLWHGLIERDPSFLPAVFDCAYRGRRANTDVVFWNDGSILNGLHILSPTQWRTEQELGSVLPIPDKQWRLEQVDEPSPRKKKTRSSKKTAKRRSLAESPRTSARQKQKRQGRE
jgi:hypothetical protein